MAKGNISQCQKVVRHIDKYGSITSLDAIKRYGITRLASRIYELKKYHNFNIEKTIVAVNNKYGQSVHYAKYYFADEKETPADREISTGAAH